MTDNNLIGQTAREYISSLVLPSDPLDPLWNSENRIFRKQPKWNYIDACMIGALLMFADDSPELLEYAVRFTDTYVLPDGTIPTMKAEDFNLDNIRGGMNLIKLYKLTGCRRYLLAYEKLYREQLSVQPKLNCGCYWHKAVYPQQMWLDGTYMALPFLAAFGIISGDDRLVSDALRQLQIYREILWDPSTGLYYHGFDETRKMYWADYKTGLSGEFWLRANGWLCAGLAEIYELTGDSGCGTMLRELTDSLSRCVTDEYMLMQLPAKPQLKGNYPETSGTLLFACGAIKGHRLGTVSEKTAHTAKNSLHTVTEKYIQSHSGIPVLKNICLMGGLGGESHRDGSERYYLSERIVENDAKGISPYLMAAKEYEILFSEQDQQ